MKYLLLLVFLSSMAKADIIIGPSVKYGVNGYTTSGTPGSSVTTSSSASSGHGHNATSSSSSVTDSTNGGVQVQDRIQAVVGLKIQTVPSWGGLSFGGGLYMDGTAEFNIGIRL